jgi:hypothetical protein
MPMTMPYIRSLFARHSIVCEAYGLKRDKELVYNLEDNMREQEAIDKLISECVKPK